MKAALAELSPAERTAIVMRHWDGCGIEEIATVLKSNSNATKNRYVFLYYGVTF